MRLRLQQNEVATIVMLISLLMKIYTWPVLTFVLINVQIAHKSIPFMILISMVKM
jgi:hypothetical protein